MNEVGKLDGEGVRTTQWLLTCCPERSSTDYTGLFFGLSLLCAPLGSWLGWAEGDGTGQGKTVGGGMSSL